MQGQKVFTSIPGAESETVGMVAIRLVLKVFTWSQSTSGGPLSGNHPGGPFFRGFRDSSANSDIEQVKCRKSSKPENREIKIQKLEIIINRLFPKINHSIPATCTVRSELRLPEPRPAPATPFWVLLRKLWAKGGSQLETYQTESVQRGKKKFHTKAWLTIPRAAAAIPCFLIAIKQAGQQKHSVGKMSRSEHMDILHSPNTLRAIN